MATPITDLESRTAKHIAQEAFIRRAASLAMPFMLKGSYVTRQYFPEGVVRYPADLDWVYLEYLDDPKEASERFDDWMIAVTELDLNDGVKFRSYREEKHQPWRMVEYMMAEDFPTVNAYPFSWVDGKEMEFDIDISFNLDVEQPPIPLHYKPHRGAPFDIPFTVPLCLQISWKIHQTLVRPRFKDLFDLSYLVKHPSFDEEALGHTLQALVNECAADNVDRKRLENFLSFDFKSLFSTQSHLDLKWMEWKSGMTMDNYSGTFYSVTDGSNITEIEKLPLELNSFLSWVADNLAQAGIGKHLMDKLPQLSRSILVERKDGSINSINRWE